MTQRIVKFNGKLNNKTINYFTSQLDYSIKDSKNRIQMVKDILYPNGDLDEYFVQYFNQDISKTSQTRPYFKVNLNVTDELSENNVVCRKIEQMTNYILFNKESLNENENLDNSYMTDKSLSTRKRREESFESMLEVDDVSGNSKLEKEIIGNKNVKKAIRQKIYKKDLENKYIKQIQDDINALKKQHDSKKINLYKRLKYRKFMGQMKEDQKLIKDSLYGTIYFKSPLQDTTIFCFDSDTGYYDDCDNYVCVSENMIDFSNKDHIYYLLEHYSDLRMEHYDNLESEMRYILDSLDCIIENCDTLTKVEKDIIIMQIDRLSLKSISDKLKRNYGLSYSERFLSNLCRNKITKKLSQFYIDSYEEWFYTFKAKGDYKKCSKCGKNKLANEKYFSPNKLGKDGLRPICKECR